MPYSELAGKLQEYAKGTQQIYWPNNQNIKKYNKCKILSRQLLGLVFGPKNSVLD